MTHSYNPAMGSWFSSALHMITGTNDPNIHQVQNLDPSTIALQTQQAEALQLQNAQMQLALTQPQTLAPSSLPAIISQYKIPLLIGGAGLGLLLILKK